VSELERARDHYLAHQERFAAGLAEAGWLRALRAEATAHFAASGLPSTRLEAWRYTNVAPIAAGAFEPAGREHASIEREAVEAIAFPVFACSLFVFVNGHFEPSLSVSEGETGGVRVESLARLRVEAPERLEPHLGRLVDTKAHAFAALNTAFFEDGALVTIPKGVELSQPIHLVFVSTGEEHATLASPRVLIVAEPGSRGVVIQDHVCVGAGQRFTNAVTEAHVGANARLDLILLQRKNERALHVANLQARLERDARFASHTLTLGGRLVRNDLGVLLADEGADATLNGLFLGTRDEVLDNHTLVDHAVPHGTSRELYKGMLGGRSRGVFRGRVIVRPDAQHTDARQSNANLLLAAGAEIDTKPQLEIHANDVKCSHGSTIGRLDPDALFYLRSRGLGEARARDLLTQGFAAEVLDATEQPALAAAVRELMMKRLHAAGDDA
jgi:Fe-S cluster assembly protein SufD